MAILIGWRHIQEERPEVGRDVLWWISKGERFFVSRIGENEHPTWRLENGYTHWRELPEPPE